jgi:hypothetical protein
MKNATNKAFTYRMTIAWLGKYHGRKCNKTLSYQLSAAGGITKVLVCEGSSVPVRVGSEVTDNVTVSVFATVAVVLIDGVRVGGGVSVAVIDSVLEKVTVDVSVDVRSLLFDSLVADDVRSWVDENVRFVRDTVDVRLADALDRVNVRDALLDGVADSDPETVCLVMFVENESVIDSLETVMLVDWVAPLLAVVDKLAVPVCVF